MVELKLYILKFILEFFSIDQKNHKLQMKNYNFEAIDLVIVNFYPFQQALKNNSNIKNVIENIDIGGPTMVRAAAKISEML